MSLSVDTGDRTSQCSSHNKPPLSTNSVKNGNIPHNDAPHDNEVRDFSSIAHDGSEYRVPSCVDVSLAPPTQRDTPCVTCGSSSAGSMTFSI